MLSYCLKCGKSTKSISPQVSKAINGGTIILSKCAICGDKKSKFIKKHEAKGLLSNLDIRTLLSKIPILRGILFYFNYKMNDIINKFLLAGDKFMPEMHLRQAQFTYSGCRPFTKNKETGDSRYIYRNELDKACFQHDKAYGDFKDLARRTAVDKILRDKAFNIAKGPKYERYQRELASMIFLLRLYFF